MESKRQQKFSRVIQKELSELFQKEGLSFINNTIVTITQVRSSPDLALVRVFLSIYNSPNETQVINQIKAQTKEIRYKLGTMIKDQVRVIPNLEFFIDDTQAYAKRIDDIFNELHKKESDEDKEQAD